MKKLGRVAVIVGILVAISLIAVGVYELVLVPSQSVGCAAGLSTAQALYSQLAFGNPVNATKGLDHWYNFTVESSSPCNKLGLFVFQVKAPDGVITTLSTGSGVAVVTPPGSVEAVFVLGAAWTYEPGFGPDTVLTTQNMLSLFYTGSTPSSLVGYSLLALISGGIVVGTIE